MEAAKTDLTWVYLGLWLAILGSWGGPSKSDTKEIADAVKEVQADVKRIEAACKK